MGVVGNYVGKQEVRLVEQGHRLSVLTA